ncbi:MAG: phosphate ABC transporter substrate-binding protein PstS [Acidimicrobiales bacterium]
MSRRIRAGRVVPAVVLALALGAGSVATAGTAWAAKKKKKQDKVSTAIEKPPTASLTETGSTLLYPLWNIWAPAYQQKYPQVKITTAGTGSGTGISDAAAGTVDIGSSDAYLSPADNQQYPTLENIPLAISVQVIAYNLPGVTAHLKLSGRVLSAIYQGKITSWNNPAIASANRGVNLPNMPIVALHRSDGSGDTFIFTTYLSDSDPNGWGKKVGYNTSVQWPSTPGGLAEEGNGGMVSGCKATPGCIAYVGISYLSQLLGDGLTYGQLLNGKGQYELPTSQAVAAEAAYYLKKTPASGTISLIDGPVKGGYPIINYEYAIVNTHQPSASTAKAIRSLLEWAVNPKDGNKAQFLSQVSFQPLPPKLLDSSLKQIEKIK